VTPAPAAPTAPPARRKIADKGLPVDLDRGDRSTDGGLVGPVVRIETTRAFDQSVPFLRGA
jgi:hypothetical protein